MIYLIIALIILCLGGVFCICSALRVSGKKEQHFNEFYSDYNKQKEADNK